MKPWLALFWALAFAPLPAAAEADGPDAFIVRASAGATVRAEPRADATIVGVLAPDDRPVRNLGCAAQAPGWCRVVRGGISGWARAPEIGEYPYPLRPSFDCAKASHDAERIVCRDGALMNLDIHLANTYADALRAAKGLDTGAAEAARLLRAHQHGWAKGRNDCWKADDKRACVRDAYERRIAYLRARWILDPPGETVAFRCDDDAEVIATFFNAGPLPAARVELGDRTEVFVATRTASGARYDGDFGKFLWIKGKDARFVWDQARPERACRAD